DFARVLVFDREEFVTDSDIDAELLADLPSQGGFKRLIALDLAAGKFPDCRKVDMVKPASDQDFAIATNDGRNNHDHGWGGFRYGLKASRHLLRRRKSISLRYSFSFMRNKTARSL